MHTIMYISMCFTIICDEILYEKILILASLQRSIHVLFSFNWDGCNFVYSLFVLLLVVTKYSMIKY